MKLWLVVAAILIGVIPAGGADRKDVVGVDAAPVALRVIEEKCLHCHNRQRIEDAAGKREKIDQILQRMKQRGAVVTPGEHEVIGHFWQQSPFKSK